jgi:hypothetical protein
MSMSVLYILGVSLAYATAFVTGRKLRGRERATSGALLAAHKIVSVSAIALVGLAVYRASTTSTFSAGAWAAALAAGFCWLVSAGSGAIAARRDAASRTVLGIHRAASALAVFASAAAVLLVLSRI